MQQPNNDPVLTDSLPSPCAICTIPSYNTAAARVTKLQSTPNTEKAKPTAMTLEGWGRSYSVTAKKEGREGDDSREMGDAKELHLDWGAGSEEEVVAHIDSA